MAEHRNGHTRKKRDGKGFEIVIPKKIREKYGIGASTSIHWVEKEEGVLMIPDSEGPIVAARGMLRGSGILKAYMKEKANEKEKIITIEWLQ